MYAPDPSIRKERSVPQSVELEQAILGSILFDPAAMERVYEILCPEAFYFAAHQEIYRACVDLYHRNVTIDLNTVASHLIRHERLDAAGGKAQLLRLLEFTVTSASVDQYALDVKEFYTRRQLFQVGQRISDLAYNQAKQIEEIVEVSELGVMQAIGVSRSDGPTGLDEEMPKIYGDIENRAAGLAPLGIPSGFYDLDAMTSGFQRSDLIIPAGRPSMGKTSWALDCAQHIASVAKLPVLFFSLEMSKPQLIYRMMAKHTRIEYSRLRAGKIHSNQEWERVGLATAELGQWPIEIDDRSNTVAQMRSKARSVKAKYGDLGLIVIDYLQLMDGGGENRVQDLARITRSLKSLARELDVPIMPLSQLSRDVERRNDKRPMMADLRESGAIEQDADLILMFYRDEYYNPQTADRGIAEVIIAKHRNGPVGKIKLLFDAQFTTFKNLLKH